MGRRTLKIPRGFEQHAADIWGHAAVKRGYLTKDERTRAH